MSARKISRRAAIICAAVFAATATPSLRAQAVTGLKATRVANGLSSVLFVTAPPGDYNRLFLVRQTGQVHILNLATGVLNATPFLDISAIISTSSEEGLLGLAFDPNYATNGKFYLNLVVPGGAYNQGVSHISQFQVSANPDVADTSVEKILVTYDQPEANHNGGWIGFSPRSGDDHNLYVATGDGGNGDDQGTGHIEPGGNAQNLTTLLGKMLRIHVDPATGTASIPADNPFINTSGARPEIFLYGLRNPFRDSFDRLTGNLFIGDVGQNTREEIDLQKASNPAGGENYGWRVREGLIQNPDYPNPPNVPPANAVDPIIDYPRSTGGTTIGGYIYRGKQIPALRGIYVFGDYLVSKVFTLNFDGNAASNFQEITSELFPTAVGGYGLSGPTAFGEDANGELYIAAINTGSVFKIEPVTPHVETVAITHQFGGSTFISALGVPFQKHTIQAANTLVEQFMSIGTATAAGDGSIQFQDTDTTHPDLRFYRVTYP